MSITKTIILVVLLMFTEIKAQAQHTPDSPISGKVFIPFIINPAAAGSKDFTAIDFSATLEGDNPSQVLGTNTRIARKGPGYFGAPAEKSYTRIGFGATLFNDLNGSSRNLGASAGLSYHLPLNDKNVSFISGGLAIKGIYNIMDSIPELSAPLKRSFIPNIDAGIYIYTQNLFAGISATNILGNMADSADMAIYNIPVSRQYFFQAGYKFVLSSSFNIVIEPSIIINLDDSLRFDMKQTYNPMLKLYMEAFCLGAYLHDYDDLTLFFQYKFPKLYLGTLVNFPRDVPFYKRDLTVEIAAGLNFGGTKNSYHGRYQW
jgi:type IX secretion system PorP/SprF family membrane protein